MTKRTPKNQTPATPELTDAELWLQIARESMKRFGTALPPGLDSIQAPGKKRATAEAPTKEKNAVDWKKVRHTCPKCSHEGPIEPDFGTRTVRGVTLKQSWCAPCRAATNYRLVPRQNKMRHGNG